MRHSRRCSITVIAATLLAAGWVAALLARSEGPPSAASVSEPRAAQTPASKPAPPAGQKPATGPQAAATYIGDAACIDCHDDQKKSYFNTMHGRTDHARSPASNRGCETCHGPASVHADDPSIARRARSA
jgi:hypothetical protein